MEGVSWTEVERAGKIQEGIVQVSGQWQAADWRQCYHSLPFSTVHLCESDHLACCMPFRVAI